ncbi:dienelactone hydrolase family protein [Marilutibacter alkalisoli]|uniref:Dienelactone hydrolase family protein n=1 Tax=Marilutibacter alkalisoli TaxID=2591633 RepID=A0A514BQY9_9GAMM|nr:dienelactone hydrolase family protein [Lysobacter alkalisoli]QDH69797.1 dienelactone hydrolase family protein [Lysobacter alkalisoli]
MPHWIDLETPHGPVSAWRADPVGIPRGGLVLLQEIFGVNSHIRSVAGRFADAGYTVVAPALYDPVERGVELGYGADDAARGVELRNALGFERAVDIAAEAADLLQSEGQRTGAVGFCWGGSVAFLANTRLGLPAVSYYGARTLPFLGEPLRAPMMFHFGEHDASIPPEAIQAHRDRQPTARIHVYDAGHGFNCDQRTDFSPTAAAEAWPRTLAFFEDGLR